MKKSILNLGKALKKAEQQIIKGGDGTLVEPCNSASDCNLFSGPSACANGVCIYAWNQ
ncbi:BRCT domain-containing protein [Tenacibaculum aiptasiae]|uniref:hypothetical protein n=1 Tax=Tenacibaculum aiptasiae TaxID=426481 RepID=UPI0015881514|nr:hypothetical protein [Tenacibaculum aiptasiae]